MKNILRKLNNSRQLNWVLNIAIVLLVAYLFTFFFVLGKANISGVSMEPTFFDKEHVVYSRNPKDFKRFDIIAIHLNASYMGVSYKEDIIKRVVGLPGDHVELKEGKLFINDKKVDQKFTFNQDYSSGDFGVVKQGNVFVMGDNRPKSLDSRYVGQINQKSVFGKIISKIWF